MCYIKRRENSLIMQRNTTIVIILGTFETNLEMHMEITSYLILSKVKPINDTRY